MKKNEQVVNKALPVQVRNPATCMVSAPICLLATPTKHRSYGNCALGKSAHFIYSLKLDPKLWKSIGKNVNICFSRKRLRGSTTFQPGILFWSTSSPALGPDNSSSKGPWPGSALSHLQTLCHYSPLSVPCSDPTEPDPRCYKPTIHLQAKEWSLALHMPTWIRLISKTIQVRHGSTHLWAPRTAADTAGSTCSPPAT